MDVKNVTFEIVKYYIGKLNKTLDMRVVAVEEVDTVKELIDCLGALVPKDGSNSYLMGKEQNGFKVELVEHRLGDKSLALDIRLTEKVIKLKRK